MRHKSTVYSPEFHIQFQKSPQQINSSTQKKAGTKQKEEKEGQSEYRVKEATKKQSI